MLTTLTSRGGSGEGEVTSEQSDTNSLSQPRKMHPPCREQGWASHLPATPAWRPERLAGPMALVLLAPWLVLYAGRQSIGAAYAAGSGTGRLPYPTDALFSTCTERGGIAHLRWHEKGRGQSYWEIHICQLKLQLTVEISQQRMPQQWNHRTPVPWLQRVLHHD